MFDVLAHFVVRYRFLVVAAWAVGTAAAVVMLPSLASVTQSNNAQFLSADTPSQHAAALAAPFQGPNPAATAILVAARADGPLTAADATAWDRIERAVAAVPGVTAVDDQGASADGRARRALVVTVAHGQGNAPDHAVVNAARATFTGVPVGLVVHLTGPLAQTTDADTASNRAGSNIRKFTLLFVIVLLFVVYRSLLAPLVTLIPAAVALVIAGPLIAAAGRAGMPVAPVVQQLLVVLLLGAGTDYGLFLVFRVREHIREGRQPRAALVTALGRVGQSITFSAATVVAALACLGLASFGLYRGLGPALAIGLAVMLAAALTLVPALVAIAGKALFWPTRPDAGRRVGAGWGGVAERVVRRPVPVLAAGVLLLGGLAAGLAGFTVGGFASGNQIPGSDAALGSATLSAHYPPSVTGETLLLRFADPVWQHPTTLASAQAAVQNAPGVRSLTGPLNPTGRPVAATDVVGLHATLGPAAALPSTPPAGTTVAPDLYQAYRATASHISPDGQTLLFTVQPATGATTSPPAIAAVPALRDSLTRLAHNVGAVDSGVAGPDATASDIYNASTHDLASLAPIVLAVLAVLLALLLRSLIAPLYLIATVGLSYLAALGFATIVFVRFGTDTAVNFVIPILLFVFAMALGEDYNILLMSRLREEAHQHPLSDALGRAVARTGGTITSAGLILAGTFGVLGIAGNNPQARQLGFTIAFAVLLDTFFVRTLLVPATARLLGRWNWWPSPLHRTPPGANQSDTGPHGHVLLEEETVPPVVDQ
jgi:RND superfamily putative drug exporter